MLDRLNDIGDMSKEDAMLRLKYLKREIRKHEIVFIVFLIIGIIEIVLLSIGYVIFGIIPITIIVGSIFMCYKIYKFSEPYEIEKYFIELIFGNGDIK